MSNRWERGQSPPYTLSRATTGGTVITSSSTLRSSDTGASQLSIAGQFVSYANPVFHQGNGEAAVSGYVTPSGQTLSRTEYASLFSRLSTTWGTGDGSTTFTLPRVDGAASFQGVSSPSVPRPVGTVGSGNFPPHTHNILVHPTPSGNSTFIPNAGTPFGFDSTIPPITYTSTDTAILNPGPGAPQVQISTGVRMTGTAVATALAVTDASVLPVGTIVGYIGTSTTWSNTNSPWLLCDGSAFERSNYPSLFSIIGTVYGTTTSSNFKVPDLRGRFLYNGNQYTSQFQGYAVSPTQFTVTIPASLPQHAHALSSGVTVSGVATREKNAMANFTQATPFDLMTAYGTGPANQLVPANASVLWLIKAS